jgi:hypothetical protein
MGRAQEAPDRQGPLVAIEPPFRSCTGACAAIAQCYQFSPVDAAFPRSAETCRTPGDSISCVSFACISYASSCTAVHSEQLTPRKLVDKYESNQPPGFLKIRVSAGRFCLWQTIRLARICGTLTDAQSPQIRQVRCPTNPFTVCASSFNKLARLGRKAGCPHSLGAMSQQVFKLH